MSGEWAAYGDLPDSWTSPTVRSRWDDCRAAGWDDIAIARRLQTRHDQYKENGRTVKNGASLAAALLRTMADDGPAGYQKRQDTQRERIYLSSMAGAGSISPHAYQPSDTYRRLSPCSTCQLPRVNSIHTNSQGPMPDRAECDCGCGTPVPTRAAQQVTNRRGAWLVEQARAGVDVDHAITMWPAGEPGPSQP